MRKSGDFEARKKRIWKHKAAILPPTLHFGAGNLHFGAGSSLRAAENPHFNPKFYFWKINPVLFLLKTPHFGDMNLDFGRKCCFAKQKMLSWSSETPFWGWEGKRFLGQKAAF